MVCLLVSVCMKFDKWIDIPCMLTYAYVYVPLKIMVDKNNETLETNISTTIHEGIQRMTKNLRSRPY